MAVFLHIGVIKKRKELKSMIMNKEYLEDIKECIQELPEEVLPDKVAVLESEDLMEVLWMKYQKNMEYGYDEVWAADDALEEVLLIHIPRHHPDEHAVSVEGTPEERSIAAMLMEAVEIADTGEVISMTGCIGNAFVLKHANGKQYSVTVGCLGK